MIPLHIGFTGTRHGMTLEQRRAVYRLFRWYRDNRNAITVHHGSCVGADAQAHDIARMLGMAVSLHPGYSVAANALGGAEWNAECALLEGERTWKPQQFMLRSQAIVACTQVLIAAPHPERSTGTWYTVECARRLERPVCVVYPDGRREWDDYQNAPIMI